MVKSLLLTLITLIGLTPVVYAAPISAKDVKVDARKANVRGWGAQTSLQRMLMDQFSPLATAIGSSSDTSSKWSGYVKESCMGGGDGVYLEAKDSIELTFIPANSTWGTWKSSVKFGAFGRTQNGTAQPCTATGSANGSLEGSYYLFHNMITFYYVDSGTYWNAWGGMTAELIGNTLTLFNKDGIEVVINKS